MPCESARPESNRLESRSLARDVVGQQTEKQRGAGCRVDGETHRSDAGDSDHLGEVHRSETARRHFLGDPRQTGGSPQVKRRCWRRYEAVRGRVTCAARGPQTILAVVQTGAESQLQEARLGILRLHGGCTSDKNADLTRTFSLVRPALAHRSPDWTRTSNPPINSRMLCQLSYGGPLSALGKASRRLLGLSHRWGRRPLPSGCANP